MQSTISLNELSRFLLITIAIAAMTAISAQAQQSPAAPERVGVESADAMPLSLNEAIKLALENSNDIRTSRIDVEKAEYRLTATRGAYDPQLFSETYFERSSTPVASFLGGNNSGSIKQKDFTSRQRFEWPGAEVRRFLHV
jgi:outer membrane protein TolC